MKPKISAVIPVYNNAQSALKAVDSILQQSTPVQEIILVDDASSPDCRMVCREGINALQSTIPIRIEMLEINGGPGLARHAGALRAVGDHVAFLDADDLWHRQKIEEVTRAIAETNAELLGHDRSWKINITDNELTELPDAVRHRELHQINFLMRNPIPTSSIVATTRIAQSMFRFGGRKSEDYMALILAQKEAGKVVYIEAPLCWAVKPPFGMSGEGANQAAIYQASVEHMIRLWREGILSTRNLTIFLAFFCLRAPLGLGRFARYKWQFGR